MNQGAGYNLPDKLYFRIGEVSDIVGVKPYVLRYWETEFSDVKPTKSKSGQRLYKRRDVELLIKVKELLYNEKFTINGAKKRLKEIEKMPSSSVQTSVEMPVQVSAPDESEEALDDRQIELDIQVSEPEPVIEQKSAMPDVDTKFLNKLKTDLEWCLSELRSG